MVSFTYATLTAAIQAWAENDDTDFTDNLDTIINLGEVRLMKDVDLTICRKSDATTTVSSGANSSDTLPSDLIIPRWVQVVGGNMLLPKDEAFLKEIISDSSSAAAPLFYSFEDGGTTLLVAPTPSVAITLDIGYTYRITGLSSSNTSNWLSTNAPDALLAACMLEAQQFMKEEQLESGRWAEMYKTATAALRIEEERRRRTDEFRTPEKR